MGVFAQLRETLRPSGSRARTRTLLQMEAVECGAASLGSILGYHGKILPLESLRAACGVSRDGVTAKNIVQAARTYGLDARGFRRELEDLPDVPLPAILFWNFNHFVVLEGFSNDRSRVYLNDPGMGPRTVDWTELDEAFTGIVLTFDPGPDFETGGSEPSMAAALAERLRGSELALAFVILAGLGLVVPGLIIPAFARIFVDNILVAGLESWIQPLLLGLGLTAVLRAFLTALRERYLLRLETKLAVASAGPFFWHVLRLPADFFAQRYAGDVASRVDLNDEVAGLLSGRLASTAIDLVMIVFFGAIMLVYDWGLTLIVFAAVVVSLLALRAVSRVRIDANRRLLQEEGKFMGSLMAGLQNIETVKATSRESDLFASLAGHMAKVVNSAQELQVKTGYFGVVPSLANGLAFVTVLAVGGHQVMQGDLTMGMLVAFQSLMASFVAPVNGLVSLGSELQELEGSMNRLDDVLRHPLDVRVRDDLDDGDSPQNGRGKLSGHLELRGITFGYSPLAPPLVNDFNLTLTPGSRVALVGSSGSGKSTVSKLVCQLYQPWEGQVLFDGIAAADVPSSVFASSLSFVDQDLALFDGTIRDNLTLWDRTVPDEDVVRAAKDALIHDAITSRPGGYDSPMEEGGRNFSGGQRQRLDIARALVSNPRILVLDEATSDLDPVAEQDIDERLRMRGCTCMIVAHRLSTIRDADKIIVMDRGRVTQRGTHDELLSDATGLYRQLIQA